MTAARLELMDASPAPQPSRWTLAKTIVSAYADRPQFAGVRPWLLRPTFWLQLFLGDWRANPAGTAICSLTTASLRTRLKATSATLVFFAAVTALVSFANVTWPLIVALTLLAASTYPSSVAA